VSHDRRPRSDCASQIKVTFLDRDEILAAIIRALAAKAAGYQVVSGTSERKLSEDGFYIFEFSGRQFGRFKEWFDKYIPDNLRALLRIEEDDTARIGTKMITITSIG
jgi:hypothetical protein